MIKSLTKGSLAALSLIWGALGGAVGVALLLILEGWLPPAIGVTAGVYVALFIAYNNVSTALEALREEHSQSLAASPRLVLRRAVHGLVTPEGTRGERVHVWQLWFGNEPVTRAATTTARSLMARIDFYDAEWRVTIGELTGQWAITAMPEHIEWVGMQAAVDLPAGLSHAKLLLIAEPTIESSTARDGQWVRVHPMFALVGENLHSQKTADHFAYVLARETARVRVILDGENMQPKEFRFRLDLAEDGDLNGISEIS
jgi:hypothetical protein